MNMQTAPTQWEVIIVHTNLDLPEMASFVKVRALSIFSCSVIIMIPESIIYYKILDVDECASGIDTCARKGNVRIARCTNTFGSYTCACNEGYRDVGKLKDGRTCVGK